MVLLLIRGFRLQNPKNGAQQHWFATSGEVSFVAETTGEWELLMSTNEAQNPSATNLKLRVSKESGIEWEQGFINTPSFDYPSEIECVGDNINLFDKNSITADKYINGNLTNTTKAYGDLVNSTATNTSDFMQVLKDKNYIFHFEYENLVSTNTRGYCFYNKEKQLIESDVETTYNPANKEFQVAAKQDGYIRISYDKNCTNIKFEQGEKATAYSEYGQGCVVLNIINKNFNDNEYEIGTILDDTGKEGPSKNYIRSKNYLRLDSGDYTIFAYKFSGISILNTAIRLYDKNKKYLRSLYIGRIDANTFTFNITEDVYFGRLVCLNNEAVPSNFSVEIQIEKGTTKTDYVEHEEQNYVIPVQQRMFKQDKFVKVNGAWKEMHTMGTVYSKDVSNIVVSGSAVSGVDGFYRYNVNLGISNRKGGSYIRLYSNYFKYGDSRWNNKEGICGWEHGQTFSLGTYNKNYDTAEKLKTFLVENNVEFDYELAEPIYLDCSPEQLAVLDKIEQEAHTYSEVTNVYTEDEVGAIIKTNTAVDLKSVINNVVEAQLEQIGG